MSPLPERDMAPFQKDRKTNGKSVIGEQPNLSPCGKIRSKMDCHDQQECDDNWHCGSESSAPPGNRRWPVTRVPRYACGEEPPR